MKLGILTLPLHTNYGGILQAYALQKILQQLGHDVFIIQEKKREQKLSILKSFFVYPKRFIKKYLLGNKKQVIFLEKKIKIEYPIISKNANDFITKHLNVMIIDRFEQLRQNDFDGYIVGSDQIWRPKYFENIENAYLKFTENWDVKRISYAPSFGTNNWEYSVKQTLKCRNLLKKFSAVSVREYSAIQLCNDYLQFSKVEHVLDPTMLLNKYDYIQLLTDNTQCSKGSLLTYILDETNDKKHIIDDITMKTGYIPFAVNSRIEDLSAPLNDRISPPVENWIRGFYDAKFVITDSFHACVFSILFHKPFIIYANSCRGLARFESLLRIFNLEKRLIRSFDEYQNIVLEDDIDWCDVDQRLEKYKKKSITFLSKNLE